MAGICSKHQAHEPDCTICNALIYAAIKPGTYKHFKGGLYEVREGFLSFNVEGKEPTPLICYTRRGTSEPRFQRSLEDFTALVERGDYSGPRFILVP